MTTYSAPPEQRPSAIETAGDNAPVPRLRVGSTLAIGLLAVVLTAVLVTQAEMVLSTVHIGYLQLPPVALGLLLMLIAIGRVGRRISSRLALSKAEMLVVYVMVLVAAMVSSHGVAQKLVPLLVIPNFFADYNNNWQMLFGHVPAALVPYLPMHGSRQSISTDYYEKLPRGAGIPWHAWATPLLTWGLLVALVLFSFLCLASILRRLWVDQEKLSFPLAQVPIQLVEERDGSIFRSTQFTFGALIPIVIYAINGLHQNLPVVPGITLTYLLNDYLSTPPWNGIAYTPFLISFAAIGFFYLLPLDILLSLWAFFILSRIAQVGAISTDIDPLAFSTSLKTQTIGAYVVLVGMLISSSRGYWRQVWKSAVSGGGDTGELMPYRTAVFGLFGSIAASAVWLWYMGMSPWLALFELGVCLFLIAPVMARSTAEAGLLMTETTFRPIDIYALIAPAHSLGMTNLTLVSFFDSMFLRDQRGLLLTGFLDSLRVSDATGLPRRRLLPAIGLAVVISLAVAVGLNLVLPYRIGALNMDHWMEQGSSRWVFADDAAIMNGALPHLPFWSTGGSAIIGMAITGALYWLRKYYFWWPLHPLGYALVGTWSTTEFWFPCMLAWLFKSLTIRYGGSRAVTKATPFFLGLVMGEFGMAVLFVLLNICFYVQPPTFPWS
jgi:hypothetical protein